MEKKVQWIIVDVSKQGQRLDNFLSGKMKGLPKNRIYRMIRTGEVRVNKRRCKPDYRIKGGDNIRIPPVDLSFVRRDNVNSRIQTQLQEALVYEDKDIIVINKPTGLAVHGGSGLSTGLIEQFRLLRPRERFLELVHRLDRETSGCLLVARKPSVLRRLHKQFREKDEGLQKRYLALVAGKWPYFLVDVEAPLEKIERGGEHVVRVSELGKPAHTRVKILERLEGCTLIEAEPVTGRTHQIRAHTAYYNHPILGDPKYQSENTRHFWKERGIRQMCLHSRSISFLSASGHQVKVVAPLPKTMALFLEKNALNPDIF